MLTLLLEMNTFISSKNIIYILLLMAAVFVVFLWLNSFSGADLTTQNIEQQALLSFELGDAA